VYGAASRPDRQEQGVLLLQLRRDERHEAANLNFPAQARRSPLLFDDDEVLGPNTFLRLDYHLSGNNQVSFRWTREKSSPSATPSKTTSDPRRRPLRKRCGRPGVQRLAASVLNNKTTNEIKIGTCREPAAGTAPAVRQQLELHRFHGLEPFDVGSQNTHPDYIAGPRNNYAQDLIRDLTFDDTLTWIAGSHNLKAVAWSRNGALPQGTAANFIGLFTFRATPRSTRRTR